MRASIGTIIRHPHHAYVQRTVTVAADLKQIRILDGETLLAQHSRSYDKGLIFRLIW